MNPLLDRRGFLRFGAALAATQVVPRAAHGQTTVISSQPDPKTFETGDFVWPKPAGAFVPYAGVKDRTVVGEGELREEEWNDLRVQFIREVRRGDPARDPERQRYLMDLADRMENLSYTKFFHEYAAGVSPDDFQVHGVGQLAYVGHVGLIEVEAGVPWVVEAVYGKALACTSCVERVRYDEWLKNRGEVLVWHGRLRDADAKSRAAIASIARTQVSKPYRFFNFDLMDEAGFYCSKLLWYSVFKATGIALDGNTEPRRGIWFSPLQAIKSKPVVLLSSPGNYRNI